MLLKGSVSKEIFFAASLGLMVLVSVNGKSTKEFFEEMLHTPNSDRAQNSVLDQLHRTLQRQLSVNQQFAANNKETLEGFPEYTESLQDSTERELRQLGEQRNYPICHLKRKIRRLNSNEYEYRPAYYEEVYCLPSTDEFEICSSLGFSCVQWNKTIHLTRRQYNSDCWESRTMVIPAGCECMWPVHKLGEVLQHNHAIRPTLPDGLN